VNIQVYQARSGVKDRKERELSRDRKLNGSKDVK
jgi:hypothetical protein